MMCRRAHVPLALAAALVGALVAPPRPPARRTRLRSMREFRAAEVTLERFIGELGVVEVTDWEYSGELANPLDPAQPARTKRDFAADGPPVKLQFLGFSEAATAAEINDDLNALGYVLLELLLSPALADGDLVDPPAADQDTLKRLWDDIFDRDIAKLRDYADAEEGWRNAVDLLDAKDGAGWDLLATALNANDASNRSAFLLGARAPRQPLLSAVMEVQHLVT
ncbi:hypothetical protein JL722_79 [Aureococcus anophagefferens]|nr:hypothetical protein JL722_79 [Aureococcus anophagefferens]